MVQGLSELQDTAREVARPGVGWPVSIQVTCSAIHQMVGLGVVPVAPGLGWRSQKLDSRWSQLWMGV